jgi:hypothetical protein
MQKTKSTFRKTKANEKSEKMSSFAAGAGLRLRPKSACAIGVAWVRPLASTCATGVGLKVRPKSTCVPGPWISDPRYGCHRSGHEGATGVDLCTWDMDFKPKVRSAST